VIGSSPRRVLARATLAALASLAAVALAAAPAARAQDSTAQRRPRRPAPLFASDTAITLTLVADFRALAGQRDTVNPKRYPLAVSYTGADGKPVTVRGQITTRGHFRLKRGTCYFPPLRLVFPDTGTRGTLFARQRGLKLVTHCRDTYEQHVLREYLAYRAHNLITPLSFRPRLARVRYVESRDTTRVAERWAFLLESERELAERVGGKLLDEQRGALFEHLADAAPPQLALWEYFIGNTDWSLAALHNVRLVATDTGTFAVPYDFDFSGLVDTPYSAPDARLPIRSVRERLWRGPCLSAAAIAPVLARYVAQRDAIRALYDSLPALDRRYARDAVKYIDQFYDEVRTPEQASRAFRNSCQQGT
jgi:hypothetical protein